MKKLTPQSVRKELKCLRIGDDFIFKKPHMPIVEQVAAKLEFDGMSFDVAERYDKFSAIRVR